MAEDGTRFGRALAAAEARMVEDLRHLCSYGTISAHGSEVVVAARRWLGDRYAAAGAEVAVVDGGGIPALVAELAGAGPRALLAYAHLDVVPVGAVDLWRTPPFDPQLVDGQLVARGVADDKFDCLARLHAAELLREVGGELPLTLRLLVESEATIGSPTLTALVDRHRDRLAADGCLFESVPFTGADLAQVALGSRGALQLHCRIRLFSAERGSDQAPLVPSAARLMVEALASLCDPRGRVLVPGFYDDAGEPGAAELALLAGTAPALPERSGFGYRGPLLGDPAPGEVNRRLLYTPTCNIGGIYAGQVGPGRRTLVAGEAVARVDFGLVPGQDPERVLDLVRAHLGNLALPGFELHVAGTVTPVAGDPGSALARAVVEAERVQFGEVEVWPLRSQPVALHALTGPLGIPAVMATGPVRTASRAGFANERIAIADYLDHVRLLARVMERFAAA